MAEEPTPQLAASAAPIDNAPTETTPAESGVNDTVVTNGVQAEGSEVAPEVKPSLDATAVDQGMIDALFPPLNLDHDANKIVLATRQGC